RATKEGSPRSSEFLCGLENVEQPPPPDRARMDDSVQIRQKSFADLSRLPGLRRGVQRHVDQYRCADDIFALYTSPKTRVVRILPVVAHRKIAIVWHPVRHPGVAV